MKNLVLLLTLCVSFPAIAAKLVNGYWVKGEIILTDNQVLEREFHYDPVTDLLHVKNYQTSFIYSARNVQSFSYFDIVHNDRRQFASILVNEGRYRKMPVFFEVIIQGEMNLLRRPRSVKAARMITAGTDELWYDTRNAYNYYICQDRQIVSFRRFRKIVLNQMMSAYKDDLLEFIHYKKLDLSTQRGCFMVIYQYNLLKDPSTLGFFADKGLK